MGSDGDLNEGEGGVRREKTRTFVQQAAVNTDPKHPHGTKLASKPWNTADLYTRSWHLKLLLFLKIYLYIPICDVIISVMNT